MSPRTVTVWHRCGCGPCAAVLRDVVPRLREEGCEVVEMDVADHPCAARDARVDYLPTVTATGGGAPDMRVGGYPGEDAILALAGVAGD